MSHRHLLKDHEVLDYLQLISPSVPEDEKYSCNDESEYIPEANDVEIFQNEPTNLLNELETLLTTVADVCLFYTATSLRHDNEGDEHEANSTVTARGGTKWDIVQQPDSETGRYGVHNILRESPGPTSLPKRKIVKGCMLSAFNLLMDDYIIKECTETEARSKMNCEDWLTSYKRMCALVSCLLEDFWPKDNLLKIFGPRLGVPNILEKQCPAIASTK
nr:uncharacterized protein LOC121124360 [Lepeophtheirus salmonis]